jgi:hypothetical protein
MPCNLCGGTVFTTEEGNTFRWMRISCEECGLSLEVRKADYSSNCDSPINLKKAIENWSENTQRIREKIL